MRPALRGLATAVILLLALAAVGRSMEPRGRWLPRVVRNPRDGSEMVLVPAGRFLMGSDAGPADARPLHVRYLGDFYLGRYEVTRAQFRRFLEATNHSMRAGDGEWRRSLARGGPDHPAVGVAWADAAAYCRWAGGRLPTEPEWEKAARGVDGRLYPWGDHWDPRRLNWGDSGHEGTAPVGSHPSGASPYGIEDLAGNVCEWVDGYYRPYDRSLRGMALEEEDPASETAEWELVPSYLARLFPERDPMNAGGWIGYRPFYWRWLEAELQPRLARRGDLDFRLIENRVVRGGSWVDGPAWCTAVRRGWKLDFNGNTTTGFRLAMDPEDLGL